MPNDKLRSSHASLSVDDRTEVDSISTIELDRNRRVLYFSDGTIEEPSDSDVDLDQPDMGSEATIEEKKLPLLQRFRCKVNRVGANILAGIDYVGGEFASLLGMSLPEASEVEVYQRSGNREEQTWTNKSSNNNLREVLTQEPKRVQNND